MVESKVMERNGKSGVRLDPLNEKTLRAMYDDCRRFGRPYPLSVFNDFGDDTDTDSAEEEAHLRELVFPKEERAQWTAGTLDG